MTDTNKLDKILPAIAAAQGDVKTIRKADRNKHDNYDFASVDAFFAALNPIMAKHQLIVHIDESDLEQFEKKGKYGNSSWLRVFFSITLYHGSGQSLPTVTRHIDVQHIGSQSLGSANSYVLKFYLRGLLLVPTGDQDDPDFSATNSDSFAPEQQPQNAPPWTPQPTPHPVGLSPEQKAELEQLITDSGADRGKFYKHAGCNNMADFPPAKFPAAVDKLRAKILQNGPATPFDGAQA